MSDLPPSVQGDIAHDTLHDHWMRRTAQHSLDSYAGAVGAALVRRDLALYGILCHPRGFLQRWA